MVERKLKSQSAASMTTLLAVWRSPRWIWPQVRSHIWSLQNEPCSWNRGSRGANEAACFSPPGVKMQTMLPRPSQSEGFSKWQIVEWERTDRWRWWTNRAATSKERGREPTDDEVRQSGHFFFLRWKAPGDDCWRGSHFNVNTVFCGMFIIGRRVIITGP